MTEPLCSCGRQRVELGCDLCAICRAEYEERQDERRRRAEAEYEYEAAWWADTSDPL